MNKYLEKIASKRVVKILTNRKSKGEKYIETMISLKDNYDNINVAHDKYKELNRKFKKRKNQK